MVNKKRSSAFDLNSDGKVDYKDALVAAKIAGAVVAGAGTSLAAGAYGGALTVSGTATAIATGITASAGATAGAFTGALLGATTTSTFVAVKSASGAMIVAAETATAFAPGLVSAFSAMASIGSAMNAAVVSQIAGLPVIQSMAVNAGVSKGSLVVIGGVPILRETAIATGLISLVIIGGYAYLLLNEGAHSSEAF
jgi:hypothetical protein